MKCRGCGISDHRATIDVAGLGAMHPECEAKRLLEMRVEELEMLISEWYEAGKGIILNPHQACPDYIAAAEALRAAIGEDGSL